MTDINESTEVLSVRLPLDLAAELRLICRVDRVSISEGLRASAYKYVAIRRADGEFQARLKELVERERETVERIARAP